ncbi:MAG: glycosyltransferase involved in cell wall biosynthesis [Planctomycetota bacterium]|jgi:glycosyltransferase involved in cell wall biosynthesis
MKVLYLTDSLSDLDGVGRYAMRLIAELELAQPGMQVEVLLSRKHRPTSDQVPKHWRVRVALPPDYFFYMPPVRFKIWYLIGLWNSWRAARRADIVHAIKDFPHNMVAVDAARLAGKPCIATAHGTYTIQPLLTPRYAARARKTYARFARMITVSRYTLKQLRNILGDKGLENVQVVPNAVAAEHYRDVRDVGEQVWHTHPFTLGIGELKERKGHHLALESWCRVAQDHQDLHHYIVGKQSGDEYERSLVKMAEDAGLGDRVHFLGNISEDEKIDLLQRAEIFIHTPVTAADGGFEGFGIVYLEASAAGTATIGTRDSGAEDAIENGVSGLLVEPIVDEVENALRRLLKDHSMRSLLGSGGRARALESTWKSNAQRVLKMYREVLA